MVGDAEAVRVATGAHAGSRARARCRSLLLVGASLFEFVTGILNIQYAYLFQFYFTTAHYYGAWVFTAAFAFHVGARSWARCAPLSPLRRALAPLRRGLRDTRPEPPLPGASELIPIAPAAPTMSRRALLGTVGAGSLLLLFQGAGQAHRRPLPQPGLPRSARSPGSGPNGFPVNRTAAAAQITTRAGGHGWRLELIGGSRTVSLSRAQLLAMPQHTHDLPIACVEGWSTTQRWTGVPIADLAGLVGFDDVAVVQTPVARRQWRVRRRRARSPSRSAIRRTMIALRVNGIDLSLDHGFPARVIGPAIPGVHCTKWVRRLTFEQA